MNKEAKKGNKKYNWALLEYEFITDPDIWTVVEFFNQRYGMDISTNGFIKSNTLGWARRKKEHWDRVISNQKAKLEKEFQTPTEEIMRGKKMSIEALIAKLGLAVKRGVNGEIVEVEMSVKDIDRIKNSLNIELGQPTSVQHNIHTGEAKENGMGFEGISFVIADANEIKKKTSDGTE